MGGFDTAKSDLLAPESHRRHLWDSLPIGCFIDLSRLDTFDTGHISYLLKIRESIISLPLKDLDIGELPFGSMKLITCGDVPVAYRLDAPKCASKSGRNYVALMRRNKPPLEVRRIFVDGTLVVLGDDESYVAIYNKQRWMG